MLTLDQAKAAVCAELQRRYREPDDSLVIVEERTMEKPFGWVFYYNSRRYLLTQEIKHAIAGNGPVIVNKRTGEIKFCGTSKPASQSISDYEGTLER